MCRSLRAMSPSDHAATFSHRTRDSNLSDSSLNQEPRINFPNCSDKKAWKGINDLLAIILPQRFSSRKIANTPPSDLAREFDEFLHSHEEFGPKPVKTCLFSKTPQRIRTPPIKTAFSQEKQFNKNLFAFGAKLFKNTSKGAEPSFSEKRGSLISPMHTLIRRGPRPMLRCQR